MQSLLVLPFQILLARCKKKWDAATCFTQGKICMLIPQFRQFWLDWTIIQSSYDIPKLTSMNVILSSGWIPTKTCALAFEQAKIQVPINRKAEVNLNACFNDITQHFERHLSRLGRFLFVPCLDHLDLVIFGALLLPSTIIRNPCI